MSDDFNSIARISYLTLKMGEQVDLLPKYTRLPKTDFRSINKVMTELRDFNINNIQNAKANWIIRPPLITLSIMHGLKFTGCLTRRVKVSGDEITLED